MSRAILTTDGRLIWWCPACKSHHGVPVKGGDVPARDKEPTWQWNGSEDRPTLSPSVKHTIPQYRDGGGTQEPTRTDFICHYHIVNGRIEYQADCSHDFAGAHVDLDELQFPRLPLGRE